MAAEKKPKPLSGVILTIVIILVLLIIIAPFIIDGVLKTGIQTAIKKQLNVDASVAKVHLNIGQGAIEVNGLKIGNPAGYEFENILEVGSISVKADVGSLLSNTVEISDISIADMTVVMEQKGLSSNLNDILKAMPKTSSSADTQEPAKKGKNVHIASLDIKDLEVKAKILPLPGKSDTIGFRIASLHFSDIGGEKKSFAEVVGVMFTKISNAIAAEGADILPKNMLGPINENLSQAGDKILKAGEGIVKDVNGVSDKLKGLFQNKKKE